MAVGLQGTCAMLLALGAGNGLNASIGIPHAEFRRTYSLCPNGRIVIQTLYGDVRITAWDRDEVLVEAIKRSPDARRLDDARIVVDSSEGLISIRTRYAGSDAVHPASVEYRITVPRGANLEDVKLINGGLFLNGGAGPGEGSSGHGDNKAGKPGGEGEPPPLHRPLEAELHPH